MSNRIIKGKVQHYDVSEKYDDNGNRYKHYFLVVNSEKIHADVPPDVYFEEKADIVLEVNEKNEAIAGMVPYTGVKWGKLSNLKKEVDENEKYRLIKGTVIEKRKETQTRVNSSSAVNARTRITYTVVLKDKNLRTEEHIGKQVKAGDQIAAAAVEDWAVVMMNTETKKIIGGAKPAYLFALVLLIAFNTVMLYLMGTGQQALINNFNMVLIAGNIVLVISFLVSLSSYRSRSAAERFLKSKINS